MSFRKIFALIGLFPLISCGSAQPESELNLVGGKQAKATQYGSAVYYKMPSGFCSGTKVSSRHLLTAAHCVADRKGKIKTNLAAGTTLQITNFPTRNEKDTRLWHSGKIKAIHIQDEYAAECSASGVDCGTSLDVKLLPPPDIAIIEFTKDLPSQWPTAQVDVKNVLDGDTVDVVGYGCEAGVNGTFSNIVHKKIGQGAVVSSYKINDWGKHVEKPNLDFFASRFFLTPGVRYDGQSNRTGFSLCPGDSGGPVYRVGQNIVVGVNADYTFFDPADGYASINIHTRLIDPWHRSSIDLWLKSILPTSSFVYSGQNQSL
ncbi:trypsin-like serine protease [Oligoflexus tunisiensis]|uniref:trypsin-like serine protease n=1 Tax=Oligoflexus tunisiensis TaxID=708132 RepID=UPI00159F0176|nr:trypsin-like serine protease [Oligoflexus tunisiensis]